MRIISQDGTGDFPYDSIALSTGRRGDKERYYIFANHVNCEQNSQIIATYSSEKKMEKAMEMVRVVYSNYVYSINILSQESLERFANIYSEDDFNKNIANPYFRFPKDEDVEVSDDN